MRRLECLDGFENIVPVMEVLSILLMHCPLSLMLAWCRSKDVVDIKSSPHFEFLLICADWRMYIAKESTPNGDGREHTVALQQKHGYCTDHDMRKRQTIVDVI